MTDKLVVLERYYRRECLEISGIPAEVGDEDIEKKNTGGFGCHQRPVNIDLV